MRELFPHSVDVGAEAPVQPSEDPARVLAVVQNVLPLAEVRYEARAARVVARGTLQSLGALYEGARARRILGVMRRLLLANLADDQTWLLLHKQAAYVHVVAVCEDETESPLGVIRVSLRCAHVRQLVQWLAPPNQTR